MTPRPEQRRVQLVNSMSSVSTICDGDCDEGVTSSSATCAAPLSSASSFAHSTTATAATTAGSSVLTMRRVPSLADLEVGSSTLIKLKQQQRHRRRRVRRFFPEAWSISSLSWSSRLLNLQLPHPTTILPLLNLVDMFAVSLVVPLLFQYYKRAGIASANQRELLSSVFSVSQIVGGLMMGALTDAKLVERKTILLLSFGGSALSYAMIVFGGLHAILLSRVLVGLVKQTMTVCTTMLTKYTNKENRAQVLGRLTASTTAAWIVGPTVGALLYKFVDPRAPALLACLLFVLNLLIALVLLKNDNEEQNSNTASITVTASPTTPKHLTISSAKDQNQMHPRLLRKQSSLSSSSPSSKKCSSLLVNLRSCFSSKALGSAVVTKLLVTWVTKATSYSQLGSFYEDMYGLEPHHRGYISSYQQLLQFLVNLLLVAPVLRVTGGERPATLYCVAVMAVAVWLESQQSLPLFLLVLCPIISLSFCISDLSLQTLVTHVAPPSSMFSVLAALDVLQNAVSVSVPFYRTFLFRHMQKDNHVSSIMEGDPDPVAWVRVSALHWFAATLILSWVLTRENWWKDENEEEQQRDKNHETTPLGKKGH